MTGLRRWLLLLRIPLVLLGIWVFFALYNRFLLDANLKNLRTSLTIMNSASGVGQAEAALLLVDQTLVAQMAKAEMDLQAVGVLQYAQGTLNAEEPERPVVDAQVMVNTLAKEQASDRAGALDALDAVSARLQGAASRLKKLGRRRPEPPDGKVLDPVGLRQAVEQERTGQWGQAAEAYRLLIAENSRHPGRVSWMLRLGRLHERMRQPDPARRLYREALRETARPEESTVAQQLLTELNSLPGLQRKAEKLEQKIPSLVSSSERQAALVELGGLLIRLHSLEKAAETFREASLADPEGEWAGASRFKEAWCVKASGRVPEAIRLLQELIRQEPSSPWAAAARQQLAELHRANGEHGEALKVYEEIIAQTKDASLKALALAQAGSTALYDLQDTQKSREYFSQLESAFPGSPFSATAQEIAQVEATKSALSARSTVRSLGVGSPLTGWIVKTLPVFVQTFADRLARYMDNVGEKRLTREYSEEEFRKIVLRRVQELFPGQIQAVEVSIRPDGYSGSCKVRLGPLAFPVKGRVGVKVVDKKPHVVLHEMQVWAVPVPKELLDQIASQSNRVIDTLRLPIQVPRYDFSDGYVVIEAERVP